MRLLLVCFLTLLAASPGIPQKRNEIVELQRDVALMQDQVRRLQAAMDEKFTGVNTLLEQALDNIKRTQTSVTAVEGNLKDRLREQEKSLVTPVAAIGTKVEQLSDEFRVVRESVAELTALMRKQQLQLVDLANAIRTLQAPPAPPPTDGGATGAAPSPPTGVSAQSLYENAMRDKTGGNAELAMQQFEDYLKLFPATELAPNAQYHIGDIHYGRAGFEAALNAYRTVLEKYPENNKTTDALYMKGLTHLKLGQKPEAREEFLQLIKDYPSAEAAVKAKRELKAMGYPPPSSSTRRRK